MDFQKNYKHISGKYFIKLYRKKSIETILLQKERAFLLQKCDSLCSKTVVFGSGKWT